jgi:hypothetical protein
MKTQFVFKYIYENDHDGDMYLDDLANNKEVVVTLNGAQSLKQIFEEFKCFLQSAGYVFGTNDYIDKINDFDGSEISLSGLGEAVLDSIDDDDNKFVLVDKNQDLTLEPLVNSELPDLDAVDEYLGAPMVYNGGIAKPIQDDHLNIAEVTSSTEIVEPIGYTHTPSHQQALDKISKLQAEILPFLQTLRKDPEKAMIRWPNRQEVVEQLIEKIKTIIKE